MMMKKLIFLLIGIPVLIIQSWGQGFMNIAETSGIDFSYSTVEYGGGLSMVDFNQDGFDDLSFATPLGESLRFFIGGESGLTEISPLISHNSEVKQLLWVDYDNDGVLDLYLTSATKNKLYRQTDTFIFQDVTLEAGLDFPELTSYCSTWFDYDLDGYLDLCVAHRTPSLNGSACIYHNDRNGGFEKVAITNRAQSVLAMTIIDANRDGWDDIFLAQDYEKGNILLQNNQNGTFTDVSISSEVNVEMNSMTASVADVNDDGWEDIYVTNTTEGNIFLLNDQDGTFTEASADYHLNIRNVTFGAIFFDADNDMDLDLHIGGMLSNYTFENPGQGEAFIKRNTTWGFVTDAQFNNGVAMGDLNQDGYLDFAKNSVTRTNFITSQNSVWQNQFSGNNYLKMNLVGRISNQRAIGARIQVFAGGKIQHRRIACGESFSSQHSYTQHVGLANHMIVDSVKIFWPAGQVSIHKNITANQLITLTEPLSGCMDVQACNYHPLAQSNGGNCRYPDSLFSCFGCLNDTDQDGVCDEQEVQGCMDPQSCSFNAFATDEDHSCVYLIVSSIQGEQEVTSFTPIPYSCESNQDYRYIWTVENGSIVLGQGSAEIMVLWHDQEEGNLRVQVQNETGCTSPENEIRVSISPVDFDPFAGREVFASPNPFEEQVSLHGLVEGKSYSYQVTSVTGRKLSEGLVSHKNNQLALDFPAGIYLITLQEGTSSYLIRLIKT